MADKTDINFSFSSFLVINYTALCHAVILLHTLKILIFLYRWYGGCKFEQQTKGRNSILRTRATMSYSPDNVSTAYTLIYSCGVLSLISKSTSFSKVPSGSQFGFCFEEMKLKSWIIKQMIFATKIVSRSQNCYCGVISMLTANFYCRARKT